MKTVILLAIVALYEFISLNVIGFLIHKASMIFDPATIISVGILPTMVLVLVMPIVIIIYGMERFDIEIGGGTTFL